MDSYELSCPRRNQVRSLRWVGVTNAVEMQKLGHPQSRPKSFIQDRQSSYRANASSPNSFVQESNHSTTSRCSGMPSFVRF